MKDILEKYFSLDDEVKEILPFLYMYQQLLEKLDEFDNNQKNLDDEEKLMEIIIKCWYATNLEITTIINKILSILNYKNITIEDLVNSDIDRLYKLIEYENPVDEILEEFESNGYYCIVCRNKKRFLLIIDNGIDTDLLTFNSLKEILTPFINRYIIEKRT